LLLLLHIYDPQRNAEIRSRFLKSDATAFPEIVDRTLIVFAATLSC